MILILTQTRLWLRRLERQIMKIVSARFSLLCFLMLFPLISCTSDKQSDSFDNCKVEFAYVDLDGNIYSSDVCKRDLVQLTTDARMEKKDVYILPPDGWSTNGDEMLALNAGVAYLINIKQGSINEIGLAERVKWSPTDLYILLIQEDKFTVYKRDTLEVVYQVAGYAPSWIDDKKIIFVTTDYTGDIPRIYDLSIVDIENSNVSLVGDLYTSGGVPFQSSVSQSGRYSYFFSPLGEFSRNFVIVDLLEKTRIENSFVHLNSITSIGWVPNEDKLMLCYGYVSLFAPDSSDEYIHLPNQECWMGGRISWDSMGTHFSYLVPDGRVIKIIDSKEMSVEHEIEWIREKPGGTIDGPYLSPDGAYVTVLFDGEIKVHSLTGTIVFTSSGSDFEWRP